MLTVVAARGAACLALFSILFVVGLGAGGSVGPPDVLVARSAGCPSSCWQIMHQILEKTVLEAGCFDVGERSWRSVPACLSVSPGVASWCAVLKICE